MPRSLGTLAQMSNPRVLAALLCVGLVAACGKAESPAPKADIGKVSTLKSSFGPDFKIAEVAPTGIDPKLLAGQKQHDEFRCLPELRPIGLQAERIHPGSHLVRMATQVRHPLLVILGFVGVEIGRQHRLGIHHDLPARRQIHNHVGTKQSFH